MLLQRLRLNRPRNSPLHIFTGIYGHPIEQTSVGLFVARTCGSDAVQRVGAITHPLLTLHLWERLITRVMVYPITLPRPRICRSDNGGVCGQMKSSKRIVTRAKEGGLPVRLRHGCDMRVSVVLDISATP